MEEFRRIILENDFPLLIIPMKHSLSVGVSLMIKAGSKYEPLDHNGVSHLLEHMLLRGSTHYPTQFKLMSEIDKIGGMLEAKTSQEMISLSLKIPKENLEKGL